MKKLYPKILGTLLLISSVHSAFSQMNVSSDSENHKFNSYYTGKYLDRVAFPIGGIGAGMFCMEGTGSISHLSVKNKPEIYNEPFAFAAISVKGVANGAKVLEAQVPTWKLFGPGGTGNGGGGRSYGLPRFENGRFLPRFPFATLALEDKDIPFKIEIQGWSPFIPTDEDNSSLPAGAMEYHFTNNSANPAEAVFSWNARNFVAEKNGRIIKSKNGFTLISQSEETSTGSGFTIFIDDNNAVVDYCWFRGGWFDPLTILWKTIKNCGITANPPVETESPGASIFVPFKLLPGEEKTITVNFCWYLPDSKLASGKAVPNGPAFRDKPSEGSASGQQKISGFIGKQLVNTFDPGGDGQTGILQSSPFKITKRYLKFLVGGGNLKDKTSVNLTIDGKNIKTATGNQTENLEQTIWDLKPYLGKQARIKIIDLCVNPWGHVLADQFVLTDKMDENLNNLSASALLIEDFEKNTYGKWESVKIEGAQAVCCPAGGKCEDPYHKPWYARRFQNVDEVVKYWTLHYAELKKNSELFRDAFFSSTLPAEVIEAVAANLTIIKSPTVLRQSDGRLWAWEGCGDNSGCCSGSCTHVWNYAQAIPHLFPALERSLRETEFEVSQNAEGHQTFRANLPISEPKHDFHAASDGQLGGIMKIYREWRISGNTEWMKKLFPYVKKSLDYGIATWDPGHNGYLEEPHHNTYDIEFWGPEGMCTSFYLGALTAFVEMSKAINEPYNNYETLLSKGKGYMEKELFNGEYFIQKIKWTGLKAGDPVKALSFHSGYSPEALELMKKEGPKYQYGTGCLSDGILGMWIASVCGLNEIIDSEKTKSHLNSVYKYNLKTNLMNHDNPQRPTYACGKEGGLLLCTWPQGGELSLPFVYSNEVWTGIEYQVASHLMFKGEVEKGLEIVRECRKRYDGVVRNPFNEYECGHWYARAMSSYGLLQGLTGVRYDAVDHTLYIDSRVGDFKSFLSTESGFGTVGLKNGNPFVNMVFGNLDVKKVIVAGVEKKL